jgi:hypothetical protein
MADDLRTRPHYYPVMHLDLEHRSEPELAALLDRYFRQFDVAYGTLLRLSEAQLEAYTMRKQIAGALKVIESYPKIQRSE